MSVLDRLQKLTPQEKVAGAMTLGALSFIGACASVAVFKFGLLNPVLPKEQRDKLEFWLKRLADATAPSAITSIDGEHFMRRRVTFLQRVYGRAACAFAIGGAGTYMWCKNKNIPVTPAIIVAGVGFLTHSLLPPRMLSVNASKAIFTTTAFAAGVALGPMNYVAKNNNSVLYCAATSTMVAFTISPMLTRGHIANAFVASALSASLCHVATKALVLTTFDGVANPFDRQSAMTLSERALEFCAAPVNLDTLLLLQAASNAALGFLHCYPVLSGQRDKEIMDHSTSYYLRVAAHKNGAEAGGKASSESDSGDDDKRADKQRAAEPGEMAGTAAVKIAARAEVLENKDALFVAGAVTYGVMKLFQYCCRFVARAILKGGKEVGKAADKAAAAGGKDKAADVKVPPSLAALKRSQSRLLEQVANSSSMAAFVFLYVKLVHRVQRLHDVEGSMKFVRRIFEALSPVKVVEVR